MLLLLLPLLSWPHALLLRPRTDAASSTAMARSARAVVLGVLLLCLGGTAAGLNVDGVLLLSFKYAVTADPLSALAGWSYADDSPCSWNGVMCMGFPPSAAAAVNLTSSSTDESAIATVGEGRSNSSGRGGGVNASLAAAAATVSRVISLVLPNAQLAGSLPADIGLIEHLRHLDLSGNSLNGSLPATLLNASELRVLSLAGNDISGELPDTSSRYSRSLKSLNLSDNALAGGLPASLCALPNLSVLALANNYLSGELPAGGLGALEVLDISANLFNGSLPLDFGGRRLRFLNLSSNRLAGAIPAEVAARVPANATVDLSGNNFTGAVPQDGALAAQGPAAFAGNPGLCGPPLKQMCSIPSSLSNPPNVTESPPAFAAIPKNPGVSPPGIEGQAPGRQEKLRPAAILAIAAGDVAGIGLFFMLFLYVFYIKKKKKRQREQEQQQQARRGINGAKTVETGRKQEKPSTSMACCIGGKNESSDTSDSSASSETEAEDGEELKKRSFMPGSSREPGKKQQQQQAAPATLVTVDGDTELEMETLLKASAYILGATGSSIVYKAVLADGTALAVRRIGESGGIDKLKDFEGQVRAVARFRHPNILRLRGFYWGADEKLLIHDYAPNGSLANIAFSKRLGSTSSPLHLNLEARLRIARGVARGLAYLHEKKCVHGNVKPSNILLSADLEPWIGDFGLDRLLSGEAAHRTGASARLFGSKRSMHSTSSLPDLSQMPGAGASPCSSASALGVAAAPPLPYQAPECLKNLRPNAKWDVYSFGMVLLELLSGRVYSEVELCQWHAGFVIEEKSRVLRMADPALRGEAEGKEDKLLSCFKLAFACCAMAPQKRPAMREAVMVLERITASATATT